MVIYVRCFCFVFVIQDAASPSEQAEGGARCAGGSVQNAAEGSAHRSAASVRLHSDQAAGKARLSENV